MGECDELTVEDLRVEEKEATQQDDESGQKKSDEFPEWVQKGYYFFATKNTNPHEGQFVPFSCLRGNIIFSA